MENKICVPLLIFVRIDLLLAYKKGRTFRSALQTVTELYCHFSEIN